MAPLTVLPANSDQDTAIRLFLDALHVEYKTAEEMDETAYLLSSPAMVQHINIALSQEEKGEGKRVTLDEIWK